MTDNSPQSPIAVSRLIHTIHIVRDIGPTRMQYQDVLGGLVFAEGYLPPEDRDMALLYVADYMIEPMAPRHPDKTQFSIARYLDRFGEGWHSFEVKVDNAKEAAAKLKAAGCALSGVYDVFFFVRAESTGGILLEVCQVPMPNDPYDRRNWNPRWAEGMPSGLLRLDHIACAVTEMNTPLRFFTELLDGKILSDERVTTPQPARRVFVRLGDKNVAFVCADDAGSGPIGAFLSKPNSGIYAMVWQVEDVARSKAVFAGKGLGIVEQDCIGGSFAIDPRDFRNARHEFKAP
ncbi:MAG: VOC family protein [Rhizomicrobium sp.]